MLFSPNIILVITSKIVTIMMTTMMTNLCFKAFQQNITGITTTITGITTTITTNLCFQGLVTANSPGAVATPVSGSLVAFVAFSLVMMLTMMVIYGDIDFGADEDADTGDGDSGSDKCTFAEVGTENFFFPSRANLKRKVVVHHIATTLFFILLKWLFF